MDTNTYDLGRLDLEELLELRSLQAKMQDENSAQAWPRHVGADVEYTRLTLEELLRLEDLHYRMAGLENPRKPAPPYVHVIMTRSGVTAASYSAPAEPVAIAPGPAPAAAVSPATPAQPEKLKRPAEDIVSAVHQLDGIMRFGYDLPEEPR